MTTVEFAELSRRLGRALGGHDVLPDERTALIDALEKGNVQTWEELPAEMQALVREIESRPFL